MSGREGRPYVAPEWQLLYKSTNPRPKDTSDFLRYAPALAVEAQRWLLDALRLHRPESHWVRELENMIGAVTGAGDSQKTDIFE